MSAGMFDHLVSMTDERGLFEHALGTVPRHRHGYCVDDNARLLIVTSRATNDAAADALSRTAMAFLLKAQVPSGRSRNRMDASGNWTDTPGFLDCWGRATWGFGVAATTHPDEAVRTKAQAAFDRALKQRSKFPRAMAFAAMGAADVLAVRPEHAGARAMLTDAVAVIGAPLGNLWRWPEPRLSYANAALAEAVIAAGGALGDDDVLERGLRMLHWLLELETPDGHLSPAGVGGRGSSDRGPQFDQQPIEAATMADACVRALSVTGDASWADGLALAMGWFTGRNDTGAVMRDEATGGCFDGLREDGGVNQNQGAESTLAMISTMQHAARFAPSGSPTATGER